MPDLEDTPTEGEPDTPVDAAQGAEATEAPPWGDDFDAGKAWNTITTQRQAEKELKEELRQIREDREAFLKFTEQHHRDLLADEEDEAAGSEEDVEFEDDDQIAPVRKDLDEIKAWQQEREAERVAAQIRTDLTAINEGSDWELDQFDHEQIVAAASRDPKGFDKAALERAHKSYIDRLNKAGEVYVERAKKPKPKPSHVPNGGKAATGTTPVSEMTTAQREKFMLDRAAELMSGS